MIPNLPMPAERRRALDWDPGNAVEDFSEINWGRHADAKVVKRHLGHFVLHQWKAWATILIVIQDRKFRREPNDGRYKRRNLPPGWDPPRYILTRWQKLGGLWRLRDRFRLTGSHVDALPEVLRFKEKVQRFLATETPQEVAMSPASDRVAGLGGPFVPLGNLCSAPQHFAHSAPVERTDCVCDEPFGSEADVDVSEDPFADMAYHVIVPDLTYKR